MMSSYFWPHSALDVLLLLKKLLPISTDVNEIQIIFAALLFQDTQIEKV